jgi:6-pyruvoyltetrahydropterin/6-carboxytetrahydropterin synthase
MFSVTKEFEFAAAHRLHNYKGRRQFLHGHNYRVLVTLEGCIRDGMVKDFGEVKDTIGKWIDENLDHATLVCIKDEMLTDAILKNPNTLGKHFAMEEKTTAENIAKVIYEKADEMLSHINGIDVVAVDVYENDRSKARYEPL